MNSLPNEILCKIFQNLSQKQLITLTTVSKRFNEVIESNRLIKGIKVDKHTDSSVEPPKRIFTKATFRINNPSFCTRALRATADTIEEVTFEHHATNLSSIVSVLNLPLRNVKKITFRYVSLEDDEEVAEGSVQPLNGIALEFYESSPAILKVLHNVSASQLVLRFYGDTPYYNCLDLLPFMRVQKILKSFSVGGVFESNLFYGSIPRGDYRLREFKIVNCDLEDWSYLETYLSEHTATLEKLSVEDVRWDPSAIVNQCTRLKSLHFDEVQVNAITEELPSVEELALTAPSTCMTKFPNVKKLFVKQADAETNRLLSAAMKSVQEITVQYGSVSGCRFEKATKMTLINVAPIEPEFFTIHTNVEELTLKNTFQLDDAQLEVIVTNLRNLRVLNIHTNCNLTARAFEIIKRHCKNLKVLDMRIWSQAFSSSDWKCLYDIAGLEIYKENFDF